MNRRQKWLQRMTGVAQEFLAARTAAEWLDRQMEADPAFGWRHGWEPRGGVAFSENVEATYLIRLYAEFEAGLRDYWESYRGRDTRPDMIVLVRQSIPTEAFSQDCIDNADDVRLYRNFLVHDMGKDPPPGLPTFTLAEAKRHLSEYFSRLNPRWK